MLLVLLVLVLLVLALPMRLGLGQQVQHVRQGTAQPQQAQLSLQEVQMLAEVVAATSQVLGKLSAPQPTRSEAVQGQTQLPCKHACTI